MSVTIEVYRNAGERPGDAIVEPLLGASLNAAIERGRGEWNARAHRFIDTKLDLVAPRLASYPGELLRIWDPVQGAAWTGRVTGIAHRNTPRLPPTTLTVERLADA